MSRKAKPLTEEQQALLEQARALREQGMSWSKIGRQLQTNKNWIRYRLDSVYRYSNNAYHHSEYTTLVHNNVKVPMTNEELAAYRAKMPIDTRDFTGRLMGDPIPNDPRRAL